MNFITRFSNRIAGCGALFISTFLATVPCPAQDFANKERAIRAHVNQRDLRGELPAPVLEELRWRGEELFTARFTPADGVGRPLAARSTVPTSRAARPEELFDRTGGPDVNSCSDCHNQPVAGGAGDLATGIFVAGTKEDERSPMPGPSLANGRGAPHIFGAGLIELLAREMTAELHSLRNGAIVTAREQGIAVSAPLETKGVSFGTIKALADGRIDTSAVEGVDDDLTIRPFGQKGVFVSLREITVHVLNHHHGMQAEERFGFARTGALDFDGDGVQLEISRGDVSAMVAWQAGLKPPTRLISQDEQRKGAAERGRRVFTKLGCGSCHIPALPLESLKFADPGPLNSQGTLSAGDISEPAIYDLSALEWAPTLARDDKGRILVPLFGDLKRHFVAEANGTLANERLSRRGVEPGVLMTAELWGLASTVPYGRRNDHATIDEIIGAHEGEAKPSRDSYNAASGEDRLALTVYLRTLAIEP